jgi:hypothetical protein
LLGIKVPWRQIKDKPHRTEAPREVKAIYPTNGELALGMEYIDNLLITDKVIIRGIAFYNKSADHTSNANFRNAWLTLGWQLGFMYVYPDSTTQTAIGQHKPAPMKRDKTYFVMSEHQVAVVTGLTAIMERTDAYKLTILQKMDEKMRECYANSATNTMIQTQLQNTGIYNYNTLRTATSGSDPEPQIFHLKLIEVSNIYPRNTSSGFI